MGLELTPDYNAINMNPNVSFPASPQPANWMSLIPYFSGGMSGLGMLFNIFQTIQRMRQLSDLRKFYRNWEQAANQKLSAALGGAASRGLSGSPNYLASLIASNYAPFQEAAGKGMLAASTPETGVVNPFDTFLKSIEGLRSAFPNKPSDTTLNYSPNSIRSGSLIDTPTRPSIGLSPDFESMFPQE